MNRHRRSVVKGLAAASLTSLAGCGGSSGSQTPAAPDSGGGPATGVPETLPVVAFDHGVASGDPLADRVVLWTRVSPVDTLPRDTAPIPVRITVARDREMQEVVAGYDAEARLEYDFCVKIDAVGLAENQWYYYRFEVGDQYSPVGRTRTFPASESRNIDRARFAVVSCANYAYGLFSVYRAVSEQADLDFILHLGDYIYEYGPGEYGDFAGREPEPAHEITELADYRMRHAQYKTDPHLQATHQQFPMICIWDDHEVANDSYLSGAENHDGATEGDWESRKQAAIQAYFEWLPVRAFAAGSERLWRRFAFGELIDLFMLDTRLEGRDQQVTSTADPERFSAHRRLVSDDQMSWLLDGLAGSVARWRFIGQQVMFAELNLVRTLDVAGTLGLTDVTGFNGQLLALNMDQWDGYVADRRKVLDTLQAGSIGNTVIFTGDIHTSWANEISADPGNPVDTLISSPLAAEFVTPSVTSPGFPEAFAGLAEAAVPLANPHMKYLELTSPGFILVDVTTERTQCEFNYVTSITSEDLAGQIDGTRTKVVGVDAGSSRIYQDRALSRPRALRTALLNPPVRHRMG